MILSGLKVMFHILYIHTHRYTHSHVLTFKDIKAYFLSITDTLVLQIDKVNLFLNVTTTSNYILQAKMQTVTST